MKGLTLDAGALIALERNDRRVVQLLEFALESGLGITLPTGALAQVWRGGARQVRLARLLSAPEVRVDDLDREDALAAGQLCGRAGTSDVVDAHVVLSARRQGHTILTSDPFDIRRLDSKVRLIII